MLQLVPLTNPLLLKAFHAAFSEKFLSLAEVSKFSVSAAAEETAKARDTLAPRYVAHVLLGTVRIYGHQVEALYAAVKKELASLSKPQLETFQAPKVPKVATTTLNATSVTRTSEITLTDSLMQLEPVSVEAPRLQARETDISFEEWQDLGSRPSAARSRSSEIPRSETFIHDLQIDQENMINVPEDIQDIDAPAPDLPDDPAIAEEEPDAPRLRPHRNVRVDPSTMLSKTALAQNVKSREDIIRLPTYAKPLAAKPSLSGTNVWISERLKTLLKPEALKCVTWEAEEMKEEEEFVDVPQEEVYVGVEALQQAETDDQSDAQLESDVHPETELSQRTHKMLVFVQEKLRSRKKLSFAALTAAKPKELRASAFYEVLQLTQLGYVCLQQKEAFADIQVTTSNL